MSYVDKVLKIKDILTLVNGLCCETVNSCGEELIYRCRKVIFISKKNITSFDFFM